MPYSKKRYGTRKKYNKYRRCVNRLKQRGKVRNPYAVCWAAIYGKRKR